MQNIAYRVQIKIIINSEKYLLISKLLLKKLYLPLVSVSNEIDSHKCNFSNYKNCRQLVFNYVQSIYLKTGTKTKKHKECAM